MNSLEEVINIFNDYYGEDKVDCVRHRDISDIIVWFPVTTVTNEQGQSTTIWDVFVKVPVRSNGTLYSYPSMAKATFSMAQAQSGYVHSHCNGRYPSSSNEYNHLCFGTGPLNSTMSSLFSEFDEGIWTLFCGELDLYVKTESIAGVPYRHLSSIGAGHQVNFNIWCSLSATSSYSRGFKDFIVWLLKNYDIPMAYNNGMYNIAMSETDFILYVSDAAHKYLETHPSFSEASFNRYILKNGKFYTDVNRGYSFPAVNETLYITFKGENKHIRVIGADSEDNHTVSILRDYIVSAIASVIMYIVNFEYGREEERSQASA